jgi:glycosyltransferase involved in cell wall biosynthesis
LSSAPDPAGGRVLVVLHEEALGGATLAVLRCVPGLTERGWQFSFWVPPGPAHEELARRGERVAGAARPLAYSVRAMRLPPGPLARARSLPGYLGGLWRRIRAERPALVHANSHTTLADAALARAAGVPTVLHLHEMFGEGPKWDAARTLVDRAGTEVVAVSEACADSLAVGRRRARVVRNGVVPPPMPATASDGPGFTVGTVGVIARRKGTDVYVEAARRVRDRRPQVAFELVGAPTDPLDAEWAADVLRVAGEAGIEHLERADVAERLLGWDVFALPSRNDPFPLSMLEAMASGLPVIGAAVDGINEQVAPGTGILVEPEDPVALAGAICDLLDRPTSERAALGAAARRRVESEFTIEAQVEGLDAAYRAAVAGSRR